MKIGYFADGPWSYKTLDKLADDKKYSVSFICARFKNPDIFLREKAKELNIDFLIEENINKPSFLRKLKNYNCDLFVSMSFDQIFKEETYNMAKLGTINCHAGKLPLYRGRNILNWALINGEKEFGITVHFIDDGIDTGDIIYQEIFEITLKDNYKTLLEKAYLHCPIVLLKSINSIYNGTFSRIPQSSISKQGMYCSKRKSGDEILNWNQSSIRVFNFIRAITYPGPGAINTINGSKIKILSSEYIENAPNYIGIPGNLLCKEKDGFLVKTADSYIKITKWESDQEICTGMRLL